MSAEAKLKELGLQLPSPPFPVASYLPWRRAGQLLYLSGQGPRDEAGKISVGRLGRDCSVERGYADARRVGLQLLSTIRAAIGSLDHVEAVIKLLGMVNAEPDFGEQPQVINGCSDVLIEVLGERGKHARSAVGMGSLPGAMTVEVEVIILVKDGF
jgi:enamine deaminase RidA (YjgF/YER057c/UK114 family)